MIMVRTIAASIQIKRIVAIIDISYIDAMIVKFVD